MDVNANDTEGRSATLEQKVAELTRRVEELELRLTECREDLKYDIFMMHAAKIADPRHPYFSWLLKFGLERKDCRRLNALFTVLNDRITGQPVEEEMRQRIKDLPHDLLYDSGPPHVVEVIRVIKKEAFISDDSSLRDFMKAVETQLTGYDELCTMVLNYLPK